GVWQNIRIQRGIGEIQPYTGFCVIPFDGQTEKSHAPNILLLPFLCEANLKRIRDRIEKYGKPGETSLQQLSLVGTL
ncbi:MAG: hypothetical protein JSU70_03540, partial [Phycisphaerales bacterium]